MGTAMRMSQMEMWDPKTGFYKMQFLGPGVPPLDYRINSLAMQQAKDREKFSEPDEDNYEKIVLAERDVASCCHDWKPVHKWLHKEYMHCLKCGAVKHQDGTIWFFVNNEPFKLTMKK